MLELLAKEMNPYVREVVYVPLSPRGIGAIVGQNITSIDCRMFYILSGTGSVFIENTAYSLSPGTVILFQSGTGYRWEVSDVSVIAVNFDYTTRFSGQIEIHSPIPIENFTRKMQLEQLFFSDEPCLNTPLVVQNAENFEEIFRFLSTEFFSNRIYRDDVLSSFLKAAILRLIEAAKEKDASVAVKNASDRVRSIVYYIQSHYKEDLTNAILCRHFGYSVTYLNRLFKTQALGTLHRFLTDYRIGIASELLCSTDLSVSEIAAEAGFQDFSYFCRIFKKKMNDTPLQYREKYKK